tara:strand:+ start:14705 stop:16624 length:1920 start_codon:yes stop_codon:yes gene_type:complete
MKNSFVYFIIAIAAIGMIFSIFQPKYATSEKPISDVVQLAKLGKVSSIQVQNDNLIVFTNSGDIYKSRKEAGSSLLEIFQKADISPAEQGIEITVKGNSGVSNFFGILLNFLPLIFFGGLLLFMMRQAQGAGSQTLNFGRSKAKPFTNTQKPVSFSDVAGEEEAKEELEEVVGFLKQPEKFEALGARVPSGVLLVGPPGTGKTLLARAVAGEAGVPFYSISGSEFVEMFVGVGASRVRDLFDQAKRSAPCIIFVDEIDAVGRHRGAGLGGGHDEREQTLNQILVEMDGFEVGTNIIILAATNRPDILDPALLRPGRFDRRVTLDLPDVNGRLDILKVHTKNKPMDPLVDLNETAKATPGFSGADLANLVNEAAILAARLDKKTFGHSEFAEAIDRVIGGPERKSRVISVHEKELTAFHEAGHALVGKLLPNSDPVQKISIVSRGSMGGYTRFVPEEDRHLWTRDQFVDRIAVAMGGRVAEEIRFGEITTGASNDLEQATQIAKQMVTRFGMSSKLGPRTFGKREELVFLGREISEQKDYSDRIAEEIDNEVHLLLQGGYNTAYELLENNNKKLHQIADYLIANETVDGEALLALFDSKAPAVKKSTKTRSQSIRKPRKGSSQKKPTPGAGTGTAPAPAS